MRWDLITMKNHLRNSTQTETYDPKEDQMNRINNDEVDEQNATLNSSPYIYIYIYIHL